MSTVGSRVDRVSAQLRAGGNVALLGPSGIGKSHHLTSIFHSLRIGGHDPLRIDLQTCTSGLQALGMMLGKGNGLRSYEEAFSAPTLGRDSSGFGILIIDEFDAVTRFDDGPTFLRHLREAVQQGTAGGLVALTASRRPLHAIEEQVSGISTLESVFAAYHIPPLADSDLCASWPALAELPAALLAVREWSGGIPTLAKRYYDEVHLGQASVDAVDVERLSWAKRAVDYFEGLGLGSPLQQHVLGPVVDELPLERARLLAMHALRSANGVAHTLDTYAPFVAELRRRSAELSAWRERGLLETEARRFTLRAVEEAGGISWDADHGVAGVLLRAARARALESGITEPNPRDVVGHLAEGEVWPVVESLWARLRWRPEPDDPAFWASRLQSTGGLGNSPGVTRRVDFSLCARYAEDLREVIWHPAEGAAESASYDGGRTLAVGSLNLYGSAIFGDVAGSAALGVPPSVESSLSEEAPRWIRRHGPLLAVLAAISTIAGTVVMLLG